MQPNAMRLPPVPLIAFARKLPLALQRGANRLTLTNEPGSNHGGWCFAFKATADDGTLLLPRAP